MIQNIITILFLCFLEGLLSFDNALVLAVLVRPLPESQRKKALTYGIVGAFSFRAIALLFITTIIRIPFIKLIGGLYLLVLAIKFFISKNDEKEIKPKARSFLMTIIMVESMDIVFSIDSILASVGVSQEYWVVLTGGILGIIMMRFAAGLFVSLIRRFPHLETSAYAIIATIGSRLICDFVGIDTKTIASPAFWFFSISYIISIVYGLTKRKTT